MTTQRVVCRFLSTDDPAMVGFREQRITHMIFQAATQEAGETWRRMVRQMGRQAGFKVRTGCTDDDPLLMWAFNQTHADNYQPTPEDTERAMTALDDLLT